MFQKASLSNTGIPWVQIASNANASDDQQSELDISDEEFLHLTRLEFLSELHWLR